MPSRPLQTATSLGLTWPVRVMLLVGAPILGAVVGFFLPAITRWAATLPWVPFQEPLKAVASIHGAWLPVLTGTAGLLGGIWIAHLSFKETLSITIDDRSLRLTKNGDISTLSRDEIDAVFLDQKELVLLNLAGAELARETHESSRRRISGAFQAHGYPWSPDGDPHHHAYRRWVPETPELPGAVNALLKAREAALKDKRREDSSDFRREAAKLGIVLRDEQHRQYWRRVAMGAPTEAR